MKIEQLIANSIIINVLPKVEGIRYLPVKYLLFDEMNKIEGDRFSKTRLAGRVMKIIDIELTSKGYVKVNKCKRFTKRNDVDSMIELYGNVDLLPTSGSTYYEKTSNFITKDDVINETTQVSKSYKQYLI